MFMFLIGLELDEEVVAKNLKNSAFISLVGKLFVTMLVLVVMVLGVESAIDSMKV